MSTGTAAALPLQQYPASSVTESRHASRARFFVAELSQALFDFVIQLLPTAEEMAVKEDVRKLLERLIRTIEPDSRLLSFGSTANGFSLRNSDMDLCCLIDSEERLSSSDMVTMLGDLLERETKFHVKPLAHARIPIVKLSLDPSPGLPLGIACDIGFENRLALENTRLLMCYAMIDPTRVRTLVLFLKVWSKRRKINSPYSGTLSSYGYVLLVIYFLVHVKNPPVLPNLQQMPPMRPISQDDTHVGGYNTWFFDDIELLRQRWQSSNTESVAELCVFNLIDFFRYYSRDFSYNTGVASIRAGLLKKESKGWQNDLSSSKYNDARERNRFCIEDPFETDFNVSRCVTKEGLYLIRGEFMRASRVLAMRPRALTALAQLCEERNETTPPAAANSLFVPPRLSIPPQTPYTVGSGSIRAKDSPGPERLSPQPEFFDPENRPVADRDVPSQSPPEHMAPKRSQWTSPPPPEAPLAHHAMFENQLDESLAIATASSAAREASRLRNCSDVSDLTSDEEPLSEAPSELESDDMHSVQSFTEGSQRIPTVSRGPELRSPIPEDRFPRGRVSSRGAQHQNEPVTYKPEAPPPVRPSPMRRPMNRPATHKAHRFSWPSSLPIRYTIPDPPPIGNTAHLRIPDSSTVYYETPVSPIQFSTPAYPVTNNSPGLTSNDLRNFVNLSLASNSAHPQLISPGMHAARSQDSGTSQEPRTARLPRPPNTPSHSHSLSTATITPAAAAAAAPPSPILQLTQRLIQSAQSRSPSLSPSRPHISPSGYSHLTSPPTSNSHSSSPSTPSTNYSSLAPSPTIPPQSHDPSLYTHMHAHMHTPAQRDFAFPGTQSSSKKHRMHPSPRMLPPNVGPIDLTRR
ncbi:hypothetical protein CONPUDRAFT_110417 [Coniophora puteana RWD-64-598 SS2]|uniref:polynucleotide adenylyltransferase n=1 Tax=Coniophora puteana (strain RWD-64-598) TaxID=741705 RepID=A0A5M3MD08_CONPW|nr:uncharacterized protein CONPUDRAFT_110417 [Coniophora puteana RWD-64-598 SS2]EIW76774.1 hypothetical protein CONPUDRAFT_110417 [Coniophora puteana RWD-64-598 SS2]